MFLYLLSIVHALEALQAQRGKELSSPAICLLSLLGSTLGSFAGGAAVGRLAPSHPTLHGAALGAAYVLLQLRQLSRANPPIPAWFALLSILSYGACSVLAAHRAGGRPAPPPPPGGGAPPASAALRAAIERVNGEDPAAGAGRAPCACDVCRAVAAPPPAAAPPPPSAKPPSAAGEEEEDGGRAAGPPGP